MPKHLSGVAGAEQRIPCYLPFLLIGASDIRWPGRRVAALGAAFVAALLMFRVASVLDQWRLPEERYREFRSAASVIERGSRLAAAPTMAPTSFSTATSARVVKVTGTMSAIVHLPYWFVPSFAAIDRDAFVPQLYTMTNPLEFGSSAVETPDGRPLVPANVHWLITDPRFADIDEATRKQAETLARRMAAANWDFNAIDWSAWPEHFDFAVDIDFSRHQNPAPRLLTEVWRGSYFSIYRVHPPLDQ